MAIVPSTPEERRAFLQLTRRVRRKIKKLAKRGKRVHIIWDMDHVLVSGRSDDAFSLLGFDVQKYFAFEERLISQTLDDGPWVRFAKELGKDGMHASQDVVTARSSFLALRAMFFLLDRDIAVRWQLFVGHQTKRESYRIILDSFRKNPDVHVIMVDDAKKHVDTFAELAAELDMTDRCTGVLSPQMRDYDEAEMRKEVDAVMDPAVAAPIQVCIRTHDAERMGRFLHIVPDGKKFILHALRHASYGTHLGATVETHRAALEGFSDDVTPNAPKTTENLFFLFELLREPCAR